ncbi:MAG: hypothetical protein IJD51_06460 [Clostridia bacterium]|nr:hypothetical protein [Clostridia bacterium]
MTFYDKEKLKRLHRTLSLNYRLTRLYADYLERYPEIIKKEMVDTLTEDGDITVKEALVALLSSIFDLDDARGGDDRRLIREYLNRSVTLLDTKKYTENPYYKSVAPEEGKEGRFEIRWEYYPPYRAAISGDMTLDRDFTEIPPLGFFTEGFRFPAVLEDGNEWMTLTPVDVDTVEDAISAAHGKVVTFGLGLGYYTYMVSEKEEVESITVVELSESVIKLFRERILPRFSHPEKVRIVCADAFRYAEEVMPKEGFDYAFVDTWRDASDGLPMYEKMKALEHLSAKTEFSYWIEGHILSRRRSLRYAELCEKVDTGAADAPKSYDEFVRRLVE